jgi:hypothetical protein
MWSKKFKKDPEEVQKEVSKFKRAQKEFRRSSKRGL